MSLTCYTMDDLRLGRGGFLRKGWTIQQSPELEEALAHYRGIPITKRKVLGTTDGFHVLELVKNVPLLPDDPEGEDVLASELGEPAEAGPRQKVPRALRAYDAEFLNMLAHCGVDLAGLGALLTREGDAQ